jgi:hypothetical protein
MDASESRLEIPGDLAVWCWRRMEEISWIDRVRCEVLYGVNEERSIFSTVKKKEGLLDWSHIA